MITPEQYADRRARVLEAMGPGVMLVAAAPVAIRNNDVEHPYRQDSDFYYLTGFDEPRSVLLLLRDAGTVRCVMFVRPRDPERETWDGRRAGVQGAVTDFGADEAHPIAELDEWLPKYLEGTVRLYHRLGQDSEVDGRVLRALDSLRAQQRRRGAVYPTEIVDARRLLHAMRQRKEAAELELMARAAEITATAHARAMDVARPGAYEYEVQAALEGTFRRGGAERPAYGSIVGGGDNATILHYVRNDMQLQEGQLLLIDAGAEYGYYASDVTRTFPVSGRFSPPQRALYDVVLRAQLAGIAAVAPGATLEAVHMAVLRVLTQGLIDLSLVDGPLDLAIEEERYKPFYMHKTSHWLGMDVHDVGDYFADGAPLPLQPGMVLTVEPGLYVSRDHAAAPEAYRGIGIRIEDDVIVTEDGCRNLTEAIPKEPDALETLLQGRV